MNVFFYGYVCWLGFQLIRGTAGTERFFMVGWMTGFFLSPLHVLVPQWSEAIKCVGAIGLAVALLAALSLLLDPSGVTGSESGTEGT